MAIETTPLGFQKPDGNESVRNGDNVIAANAQKADDLLSALPNLYMPLSRGTLANGTDLNTLTGTAHVGTYGLPSASTYPNAPARTSAAVLEVQRGTGSNLSVLQRITNGNVMVWREAVDAGVGTWSEWTQAETPAGTAVSLAAAKTYTDAQVSADRARLTNIEAKNTAQDGTLSNQATRVGALETLGGLAPGDVSDATVTDLIANPASTTAAQLDAKFSGKHVINVKEAPYNAKGDGVTNDTTAINAAITASIAAKKTVFIPAGTYVFNGHTSTGQGVKVSIEGEKGSVPVLRKTQAAADAGGYMFMFNSSRYSTVAGLALAANVKPNQPKISLASVAGLSAGMVIQISSNRLWYNGHRDAYYCGEIHKITDVDTVANTVTIEDFTRDVYTIGTDTLTIRAWVPNTVSIKNLRIEAPYPATNVTSAGIALQQCTDVVVDNVSLQGFHQAAILDNLSWNSRFTNVRLEQDDDYATSIGNNYGIESNGSVGTLVDGLYSKGLRRAFDAGSISGTTEAAIARDWRVTNFIVRGGGSFYPNTAALNYGVGMHGSSENGVFSNGFIEDCSNGVTVRGRNTTVENVTFAGTLTTAISLHENGAGLIVRNCTYDSFNYPNKLTSLGDVVAGSGCNIFVQLGLTSGGIDANCFYDLPIVIDGNVCKGLTNSFVQFSQNGLVAKNLRVTNNHIEALPGAGGTFTTFYAAAAATNLTDSVFQDNWDEDVNGTVVTWGTSLVLAYRETSTLRFKVDGTHYARIPTDTVVRIPRVTKAGQRILVMLHADAGGHGFFRLVPENASATTVGAALAATIRATATGSALTGTTGAVGDMTFGLMANGDLYIENRATSIYTFRLTIQ